MPPAIDGAPHALEKSRGLHDLLEECSVARLVVECLEEGRYAQKTREKEGGDDGLGV
jgi:hypothetical protein